MIGRFGWKASQPDLPAQNASAAISDMGLTNPLFKTENCALGQHTCLAAPVAPEIDLSDEFFAKLNLFTRLIAVPAQRNAGDPLVKKGEALFSSFGCGACHVTTLKTGPEAALPELANQTFHPFTDLLLHDMGEGLADNRPDLKPLAANGVPRRCGASALPRPSTAITGSCMTAGPAALPRRSSGMEAKARRRERRSATQPKLSAMR